ncbi:CD48 antigen-like, partial [Salminus brasiliensis]|uniref:CD48 antigen-like n=1 Tax=Salminus brasiliensis TaxID=930266 RepID=UPI003B82CCD8
RVISQVFRGGINTDYNRDRFRDRLQLDRSSGSLTIRNISREDSGVYTLHIITGKTSDWSFRVKVYGLLFTAGEEAVRLQELEGNTVTIHTGLTGVQSDAHILWLYGSEKADIKIVNSLVFRGETITDYNRDRFRDRLQLGRSSGSLTIRNISREDSGVYTLQIITGSLSAWSFRVKVYAPISRPVIRKQVEQRLGGSSQSCSPVCSVENGEDVTLSWYEEKERISSINRSDSSEPLHLPLNRTFPNIYTYTCESANPASHQTTQLNIAELCNINTVKCGDGCVKSSAPVLISVGLFGAALLLISVCFWKKRKNLPVSEVCELNHAEVKTASQKPKEFQNSKRENGTRVQDQQSVVYSDIVK